MTLFDDVVLPVVFLLVVVAGLLSLGWMIGGLIADTEFRNAAIENNAAEWRCDPKTGEKEFVWLTAKPNAEKE